LAKIVQRSRRLHGVTLLATDAAMSGRMAACG
jgi:hypothetical protein